MNSGRERKTPIRLISKGLTALWGAGGAAFLLFSAFMLRDEALNRRELAAIGVVFLILFLLCFLLLSGKKFSFKRRLAPLIAALLIGLTGAWVLTDSTFSDFILIRSLNVRILEMDDGAETGLVWAFWADKGADETEKPIPFRDISFSGFKEIGNWAFTEGQPLKSGQSGDELRFKPTGIHFHRPVMTVASEGGRALLAVDFNGRRTFQRLNGIDRDPQVIDIFRPSLFDRLCSLLLYTLALAGLLFWLFLFLMNPPEKKTGPSADSAFGTLLLSFLIPVILLIGIYRLQGVVPFGSVTFLRIDMGRQYVQFLGSLKSVAAGTNNLFYSFSKGFGGDMFSLAAYYLANPLNWLVTLFKLQDLPLVVSLLVLIRCGLCGLTAGFYFRETGLKQWGLLIFTTAYALTSYALVNAENYFFIDGMIFLPLVSLGIERLVRNRSGLLYLLAFAGAILIQFYMAYMLALFALIYFLFLLGLQSGLSARGRVRLFIRYFGWSLLAAALSSIVLLPVAHQLAAGPKGLSSDDFSLQANFRMLDLISKNFVNAYDPAQYQTGLPAIYSGSVITFLAILFLFNRGISLTERAAALGVAGFLFLSFYLQPLNLMWHGFSQPVWWPYRYAFVFCFWLIRMAARAWQQRHGMDSRALFGAGALMIFGAALSEITSAAYLTTAAVCIEIGIAVSCAALFILNNSASGKIRLGLSLFLLNTFLLTVNANTILRINLAEASPLEIWQRHVTTTETLLNRLDAADNSFFRLEDQTHFSENEPLLFSYAGLSHYSSTVNWQTVRYLAGLGISQSHYYTRYHPGVPLAADSLTGLRYLISTPDLLRKPFEPVLENEGKWVYRNSLALPLAFNAAGIGSRLDFAEPENPFSRLNRIFGAFAGDEGVEIYTEVSSDRQTSGDGTAEIWRLSPRSRGALYACFPSVADYPDMALVNGADVTARFDESCFGSADLGVVNPGDEITFTYQTPPDFSGRADPAFYTESAENLQAIVSKLKAAAVTLSRESSSRLSGSVDSARTGSFVVFSLPFEMGWQLELDGSRHELVPAAGGLTAFQVPDESRHYFELSFTPPGFRTGVFISALSVLLTLMAVMLERRNLKRPQLSADMGDSSAGRL